MIYGLGASGALSSAANYAGFRAWLAWTSAETFAAGAVSRIEGRAAGAVGALVGAARRWFGGDGGGGSGGGNRPAPTPSGPPPINLVHGTTVERAEAIVKEGPSRQVIERISGPYGTFATAPKGLPPGAGLGDPATVARQTANKVGGDPALVNMKVPQDLVDFSCPEMRPSVEWQGPAIDKLKANWDRVAKWIEKLKE
jgi:hypothetical protein